ncbi:hypothetical protein BGY98DRAFT_1178942 [Russula aff. rugulosa BPL654]|nr:hypothetical protein BGY98DRAFT_1178942 [Russula aff. rugulosa BPL654]
MSSTAELPLDKSQPVKVERKTDGRFTDHTWNMIFKIEFSVPASLTLEVSPLIPPHTSYRCTMSQNDVSSLPQFQSEPRKGVWVSRFDSQMTDTMSQRTARQAPRSWTTWLRRSKKKGGTRSPTGRRFGGICCQGHDQMHRQYAGQPRRPNAGIAMFGSLLKTSVEEFDRQMAVNARGTMLCYKLAARRDGQAGTWRANHRCMFPGWQASFIKAIRNLSGYSASKFAIRSLTQSVARELGDHGITVNAYATKHGFVIKDDYIRRLRDPFVGAQSMISFKLMTQVPEARLRSTEVSILTSSSVLDIGAYSQ